jgi:hypothetical protein
MRINLNKKIIEGVPIFQLIVADKNCLIDMIEKLRQRIFIPGEFVRIALFVGGSRVHSTAINFQFSHEMETDYIRGRNWF